MFAGLLSCDRIRRGALVLALSLFGLTLAGCDDGDDGRDGADGADGDPGLSCWDLNENGIPDFPDEDTNGDGVIDVNDCRADIGSSLGDLSSDQALQRLVELGKPVVLTINDASVASPPVAPAPVGSAPVASVPKGPAPAALDPVASAPVGSGPVGSGPVGSGPVGVKGEMPPPA